MLLDPLVERRHAELSPTFLDFLSIAHSQPPFSGQDLLTAWMDCDHVRRKLLAEMESFPFFCVLCARFLPFAMGSENGKWKDSK